jgi:hypothetical protein
MDFNSKIKNCETLKQIFEVCNEHYTTEQTLGIVSGSLVKSKIPGIIKTLNLKAKK